MPPVPAIVPAQERLGKERCPYDCTGEGRRSEALGDSWPFPDFIPIRSRK